MLMVEYKDLTIPSLEDIEQAAERIKPYTHRTPVMTCRALDGMTGASLYFKCENFQKVGAFKARGAANAVFSLPEGKAAKGVTTHSSGNHAQALALAAGNRGIKAFIVMPENAPGVKINGVKEYGGEVIFCEPTLEAREETVKKVMAETGAALIHPYDNLQVITGQATAAYELINEVGGFDIIMVPVGGGGLLSGTALAVRYLSPRAKIIAAEPEMADDAFRSFKSRKFVPSDNPLTIADGLLTSLGEITFPLILEFVDDILTVSEAGIINAMKTIWERMKIIVEPSGCVPLGAVLQHPDVFKDKRVGMILSGGNVDLEQLPWM
jgi:threonine dehydratase